MDHYQIRRTIDIYVRPLNEGLAGSQTASTSYGDTRLPEGVTVTLRGLVQAMRASFMSFGFGLMLAVVLLYLFWSRSFARFPTVHHFAGLAARASGVSAVSSPKPR